LSRWLPALCFALFACESLPDNPDIHDATLILTVGTPGGVTRVMLACPIVPGALPTVLAPGVKTGTKPQGR